MVIISENEKVRYSEAAMQMMEHLNTPEEYKMAAEYIRSVAAQHNLSV